MRKFKIVAGVAASWVAAALARAAAPAYVIHISVDGLRPDGVTAQGALLLPNFYRLRAEGSYTDNARADYDYTITLPNHTTQLTGRGVVGPNGHNWTENSDPQQGQTLHSNKGSYVASVFDVAHDNALRTGLFASKTKFSLFDNSYDGDTAPLQGGAPDYTGADNGRDKIDTFVYNGDSAAMTSSFVAAETTNPFQYGFIHFHDPDTAGHAEGWMGTSYLAAVRNVDSCLGTILNAIDTNPTLRGHTTILLTADHGGMGVDHGDNTLAADYTIPFYAWGPNVGTGDLYDHNLDSRLSPGTDRPAYDAAIQPIRNGEMANASLNVLGLGPVPGSTINTAQNLFLAGSRWSASGSGVWSDGAKWSGAIPSGAGAGANFLNGSSGARTITLDLPYTVGLINFAGPGGCTITGPSVLTLDRAGLDSVIHVTSGSHAITAPVLLNSGLAVNVDYASDTLTISSQIITLTGARLSKDGAGTLAMKNIRAGDLSVNEGKLVVSAGGGAGSVSKIGNLSIGTGARLDLKDNKLITTTAVGTFNGSVYTGVSGLLQSGYNGSGWTGDSGIVTSMSNATSNNDYTSIGVASAADVLGITLLQISTWAGQLTSGSDTLVMYTYGGDSNLDGVVDILDYGQVDGSINANLASPGWYNGDFNYDGVIDILDYGIIDGTINTQGAAFPSGRGMDDLSAASVPEPTGLLAALAGFGLTGRWARKRRKIA